jgi:hypothetical protein
MPGHRCHSWIDNPRQGGLQGELIIWSQASSGLLPRLNGLEIRLTLSEQ